MAIRDSISHLRAAVGLLAAIALITVGTTALAGDAKTKPAKPEAFTMAAADAAGWVVFTGYRAGRVEDLAPSAVKLSRIRNPGEQTTPDMVWLNHWGLVQARMAR